MFNILNLRIRKKNNLSKINNLENKNENKYNYKNKTRHYPPANKEWFNSIYAYNKNTNKSLPIADKLILKIIKTYLNLYSRKLEKKTKSSRLRIRYRKLSTNRILVSRAELKHTNDKVIITIYFYNRNKIYYLNKIKNINSDIFFFNVHKKIKKLLEIKKNLLFLYEDRMKNIKDKAEQIILNVLKQKKMLIKIVNHNTENKYNKNNNKCKSYEKQYLKNFVFKLFNKEILYLLNRQIIFLNKSKFRKTNLLPIFALFKKIYNKKVDLNLVNLKYLHLNSHIFTETIVMKLRNKKNRLLRVLKASLSKFELPNNDKLAIFNDIYNRKKEKQNVKLNNKMNHVILDKYQEIQRKNLNNKDMLQEVIKDIFKENFVINLDKEALDKSQHTQHVTKTILNLIKYKSINGLRIEAAGRLTRRYTAARSVFKLRYKGNIRNIDSSDKGLPSVILRGHARPNVQYTHLKSKLRIGSFGIKGWVSSN